MRCAQIVATQPKAISYHNASVVKFSALKQEISFLAQLDVELEAVHVVANGERLAESDISKSANQDEKVLNLMKLRIKRNSSSGMFGGASFETTVRIETTSTEANLLRQYKADKEVVLAREINVLGARIPFNITVADLIQGKTFKSKNLYELIELEGIIQNACANLKLGADVMASFGKEQIIEL